MSRQNMLKCLNVHEIVLELLKGNIFLLDGILKKNSENELFLKIFEVCFKFLNIFCSLNNIDNKNKILKYIDDIFKYINLIELGQIDLINTLFKNNMKAQKILKEE
jgi:hypothetical protein